MAGSKSDYLERVFLDLVFGKTLWTPPDVIYVGLSTAVYSDTATGSAFTETTGGGYGRVAVTNDSSRWPAATGGAGSPTLKQNATTITFPTATGGWGTILSYYLLDALSGGNVLYGADLTTSRAVLTGDVASFSVGGLTVSED